MEVGIGPQAVVERRNRRQVSFAQRYPGMGIDHSAATLAAERAAEIDEGALPVQPLVEAAGRDPALGVDGHGPRTRGGAVAVPEGSTKPAPLPQRGTPKHRRANAEAVHHEAGLDHAARGVQHQAACEADLRVAGRPVGQFRQATRRDRPHAARHEHQRAGVGERSRHDLIDQSR